MEKIPFTDLHQPNAGRIWLLLLDLPSGVSRLLLCQQALSQEAIITVIVITLFNKSLKLMWPSP